ncbi:MAG: Stress responsive Barrel Domain [Oscillospiraceae bacterium]|nr:Stress responsive Barrel Domain [Oscillospiraceae bacterium]
MELLRGSALSMSGRIDGLVCVDLSKNIAGGEYDFVFCADFISQEALDSYQTHPLHEAHKARSAPYVKHRLVADYIW